MLEILEPEDFFLPVHQKIFSVARALRAQGSPVDPLLAADQIAADPDVEAQGGRNYIYSLPDVSVPAVNAPHHARIVKRLSLRRRAKTIAWDIVEDSLDPVGRSGGSKSWGPQP